MRGEQMLEDRDPTIHLVLHCLFLGLKLGKMKMKMKMS